METDTNKLLQQLELISAKDINLIKNYQVGPIRKINQLNIIQQLISSLKKTPAQQITIKFKDESITYGGVSKS